MTPCATFSTAKRVTSTTASGTSGWNCTPEQADGLCKVRFNWHTLSFRYKTVDSYFGSSFYTLDVRGENPLIKAKKVILKNDYVRQVIDVYHL